MSQAQQQTSPADQFMALLQKTEPLDPELAAYLNSAGGIGPCVQHPLVYSMLVHPQMYAMLNEQLRRKKTYLAEAEAGKRWHQYVFTYERPYRINAFITVAQRMTDEDYWRLLGDIWTDSENIWQNKSVWRALFCDATRNLSLRPLCMTDEERAALAAKPDTLTAYRGVAKRHLTKSGWRGMSWTLDRDKARWFATRLLPRGESGVVVSRTVRKADVLAHFTGRKEEEVVLMPANKSDVLQCSTVWP